MKKIIMWHVAALCLVFMFSCSKWTDSKPVEVQKLGGLGNGGLDKKYTEAYLENLRAYKRSEHSIAFGWFGNWTANGASGQAYLSSIPDSVDMVSIWGGWQNLNDEKKRDLEYVQKVKGTKVLICFILSEIGDACGGREVFKGKNNEVPDSVAIRNYAKAVVDSINKYGYDGFDIDWEPNIGGYYGTFTKQRWEPVKMFVKEIGKYLGPKSGSGKLLCVDGELNVMPFELGEYFDYFISQAYYDSSLQSVQQRYDALKDMKGIKPGKFIITSNFESFWEKGGPVMKDVFGKEVPQLLAYASWNPKQGRKGGIGTYHMEYEYKNKPDYQFLREAIRIQNPPVK